MSNELPKLLVVDDNRANRMCVGASLRQAPIEIIFAECGQDAIDHAAEHDFFLVLMDVNMPGMTGFEAAKIIHEQGDKALPIIFITATSAEDSMDACYQAGGVDFMMKPYNEKVLIAKTKVFLNL